MSKKKTDEEYIKELAMVNSNIEVDEPYINSRTPIKHKCKICEHMWIARPNNILNGNGCPVCAHQVIGSAPKYRNSIWDSEYREYFSQYLTENQMKNYMPCSNRKVNATCPDCGRQKYVVVNNLFHEGLGCICNDKISFANKFVFNVLSQLKLRTQPEYSPIWADRKKYDVYIEEFSLIVENHGIQHYEESTMTTRTLIEEQENDRLKKIMAYSNGIQHYVVLDCRHSTLQWIKQSILNSELPKLLNFNETDVNWNEALMYASKNLMIEVVNLFNDGLSVSDIVKKVQVTETPVRMWLHNATKLGLCNYNGKQEREKYYSKIKKPVVCIELNHIFESVQAAADFVGVYSSRLITDCCKGKYKTIKGYHWRYATTDEIPLLCV